MAKLILLICILIIGFIISAFIFNVTVKQDDPLCSEAAIVDYQIEDPTCERIVILSVCVCKERKCGELNCDSHSTLTKFYLK